MDYEKMYKDALERAKEIKKKIMYSHLSTESCKAVSEYIDAIFPELAESEDERIRKELKEAFEAYDIESTWNGIPIRSIFSWLEKQKEQKPHYTKRNALFDKCVENCDPDVMREVSDEVDKLLQKEQHFSSKFHPGDWVVYDGPLGHAILQVKDIVGGRYSFVDNVSTLLVDDSDELLRPLTPKDVEKPAEWSDEDEKIRKTLLDYYEKALDNYTCVEWLNGITYGELCDWLKSLRPSWKPSEEQMGAFKKYIEEFQARAEATVGGWNNFDVMIRLYEQLKKL